jgi:hypothetical protein
MIVVSLERLKKETMLIPAMPGAGSDLDFVAHLQDLLPRQSELTRRPVILNVYLAVIRATRAFSVRIESERSSSLLF